MIKSWRHKGLKNFFNTGTAGIQPKHASKLRMQLAVLNAAVKAEDINLPGYKFHALKGNLKDYFSISVSGNWRLIFMFEDSNGTVVDYLDYH